MWVNPGALRDVAAGRVNGMVHEFTHALQFGTQGMRNTPLWGGWFWESHAEFMAHQYPGNTDKVGCSSMLAWMPHLYYGSTRNRYCNWQFWDHIKNKHGGFKVVNDLWNNSANIDGQDPLGMLIKNLGWSAATLGDEFGHFAMRNVNWDYIDVQDGYNRGIDFRREFGGNTALTNPYGESSQRLRLAKVEPIDLANRRFVVSKYYAPQRYGHNLVRLIPDAGATSVTVNFRGVVQSTIAAGTAFGNGNALEPGSAPDWTSAPMITNPASNWRWGIVAIDQNGNSRASALQRGTSGDLSFALQTGDKELYLVVVAAPDAYHRIFWDQIYYSIYRYPYKLQLSGAMPDGFQSGYQINTANGWPAGAKHANGGGWVASTARVDATAYVGPNAAVLGGQVLGNARIEDYAVVWNGTVRDTAIVGGLTQFDRNSTVADQARVRVVMAGGQVFSSGSLINGTTTLCGDVEAHLTAGVPLSSGVYCGWITTDFASTRPAYGSNRSQMPTEATAAIPPGWPDANTSPTVSLSAPAANLSVVQGTVVNLAANAADGDGSIAKVEFYDGTTPLGTDTTAPYTLAWTATTTGARGITARATDNAGATATTTAVTLTVTAAASLTNLAPAAMLATSYVSPWESLPAVNNNIAPVNSSTKTGGAYGNWRGTTFYGRTEWVSFTWTAPRTVSAFEVYWWNDGQGIATPTAANVEYWNGTAWVALGAPGRALNTFNRLNFAAVTTTSVRVSMSSRRATGILEARVWGY